MRTRQPLINRIIIAAVIIFGGSSAYDYQIQQTPIGGNISGIVTQVVDGDTLRLNTLKVRLWGVDAPETTQNGYNQAALKLNEVALLRAAECKVLARDKYARLVARCTRNQDDADIGQLMIQSGWAKDHTKYSKGFYKDDEAQARRGKSGLWQ